MRVKRCMHQILIIFSGKEEDSLTQSYYEGLGRKNGPAIQANYVDGSTDPTLAQLKPEVLGYLSIML